MEIKNEILSFDVFTGSIIVKYYCDDFLDGLIYNIDLPIINNEYPDEMSLQNLIKLYEPTAQINRLVLAKTINVPDYLQNKIKVLENTEQNQMPIENNTI